MLVSYLFLFFLNNQYQYIKIFIWNNLIIESLRFINIILNFIMDFYLLHLNQNQFFTYII